MILHSFTLKDGTKYMNDRFKNEDKDYNYTFRAEETREKTNIFPGYNNVHESEPYPGMPILSYFFPKAEWSAYQPTGYALGDAYLKTHLTVRGTFGGYGFTAYHVGASAVFSSGNYIYETPNTPCMITTLNRFSIANTSVLTEPAHYLGNNEFELTTDIAILDMFFKPVDKFLVFLGYQPRFIDGELIGIVSGAMSIKHENTVTYHTIVAPLAQKLPEKAYFTGSTSGTQVINCTHEISKYSYGYGFGKGTLVVIFKKGWFCTGESKTGDSGAPVFIPV